MDPNLANRLRRFGEQVDEAAVAAQAGRPVSYTAAASERDDTDALPTVVPIVAARSNRRIQLITGAAAAAIVVLGGALATWRIVGESDPGPADSTQATVNTTARPSSTTTSPTTTIPVTTLPVFGGVPTTSSTTTSTSSTTSSVPASVSTVPGSSPTCPRGYRPYGTSFPIEMCDRGPAVELIQLYTGADVDGFFGPTTRQSVRVFQEQHHLEVDGLVGRATWEAMFPNGAPGTDSDGDGIVEPWEIP